MSSKEKMEMLTELYKKFDKLKDMITSNWDSCKVCKIKDFVIAVAAVLLIWCIL